MYVCVDFIMIILFTLSYVDDVDDVTKNHMTEFSYSIEATCKNQPTPLFILL